jgi:glucokinase
VGGPLDAETGTIYGPPNLPGWNDLPLKKRLEAELHLPVKVEHDAAACALAEYRWGVGRGSKRLAYLTCGSGFGLGLVLDGKPYYGADGRSIELGHVRYRDSGPIAFGKRGSFEAFGAGNSLPRLAAWRFSERWSENAPTGEELSRLASEGDVDAREVLALNARAVGDACALLGDLLQVDTIILGSLGRYLGESWVTIVRERLEAQVLPGRAASCRITTAELDERLQDCSAVVVGLQLVAA